MGTRPTRTPCRAYDQPDERIAAGDLLFPEASIEFAPNAPRERNIDNLRKINGPADHDAYRQLIRGE